MAYSLIFMTRMTELMGIHWNRNAMLYWLFHTSSQILGLMFHDLMFNVL